MRLSHDRKTLLSLLEQDIRSGVFVIPDTVSHIDNFVFKDRTSLRKVSIPVGVNVGIGAFSGCTSLVEVSIPAAVNVCISAFDGCTSLAKVSIATGAKIENQAFYQCTGLKEVVISMGATISGGAFSECTSLNKIIVNSDSAEELKRIRGLFPGHKDAQFILKDFIEPVELLKAQAYQMIINDPRASILFGIYHLTRLIGDVLPIISSFEGSAHPAYKLFNEAVDKLVFPVNQQELAEYQKALTEISNQVRESRAAELEVEWQTTNCISKLNQYVVFVQKMITEKTSSHPGFFDSHQQQHAELTCKMEALTNLIEYLKGNIEIRFSEQHIKQLGAGFTGEVLSKFNVSLESLPMENTQESYWASCSIL